MKNSLKKSIHVDKYEYRNNGYMAKLIDTYMKTEEIILTACNGGAIENLPAGLNHILMEREEGKKDFYIFQASGYNEYNGLWHYMINADGTIAKTI